MIRLVLLAAALTTIVKMILAVRRMARGLFNGTQVPHDWTGEV